mmetsp:Transcript_79849/g.182960  ORF Transcript_79849/g.182960 Transcript_79849/m.182960 type:complete len:277 (-) Transcript_79849:201-1031(-)
MLYSACSFSLRRAAISFCSSLKFFCSTLPVFWLASASFFHFSASPRSFATSRLSPSSSRCVAVASVAFSARAFFALASASRASSASALPASRASWISFWSWEICMVLLEGPTGDGGTRDSAAASSWAWRSADSRSRVSCCSCISSAAFSATINASSAACLASLACTSSASSDPKRVLSSAAVASAALLSLAACCSACWRKTSICCMCWVWLFSLISLNWASSTWVLFTTPWRTTALSFSDLSSVVSCSTSRCKAAFFDAISTSCSQALAARIEGSS